MADMKERIRAILRKAGENNPSKEERDVALRVAQRLMLKHGITEADIGDLNQDSRGFVGEDPFFRTTDRDDQWKGSLLCNIAEFYFCEAFARGNHGVSHWYIVGRKEHAEVLEMMHSYLVPQIEASLNEGLVNFGNIWERHARTYCVETCKEMNMSEDVIQGMSDEDLGTMGRLRLESIALSGDPVIDIMELCEIESHNYAKKVRAYIKRLQIGSSTPRVRADVYRKSFLLGAIAEVRERLQALTKEEVENLGQPGTELVRNEKEALVKFMEELDLELETVARSQMIDPAAAHAGMRAASEMDLFPDKKLNMERRELNA